MKTIAIANRKGGVGKSTTAHALISGLSLTGHTVLGIDLDAQRNLTTTFGARDESKTIFSVLTGDISIKEAIRLTSYGCIIPGSKALSGADATITQTGKEYRLKEALEAVQGQYEYCVIDCPPNLGILTVNALTACDTVIIPVQADIYSVEAIQDLYEAIGPIKKYCNPSLTVDGILLTRYNPRSIVTKEITGLIEQLADKYNTKVYQSTIREAIAIKEAQISEESIFTYAPKSNVASDYKAFIHEFLTGELLNNIKEEYERNK